MYACVCVCACVYVRVCVCVSSTSERRRGLAATLHGANFQIGGTLVCSGKPMISEQTILVPPVWRLNNVGKGPKGPNAWRLPQRHAQNPLQVGIFTLGDARSFLSRRQKFHHWVSR